jgi:hypothetical protein
VLDGEGPNILTPGFPDYRGGLVMSTREKCLAEVEKYRQLAERSDNPADKETWQQLAESWQLLSKFENAALQALNAAKEEANLLLQHVATMH